MKKKRKKKICFSYFKLVFNDRKPYEALMLRVGTIFMCVFKLRQVAQIFQKKKKSCSSIWPCGFWCGEMAKRSWDLTYHSSHFVVINSLCLSKIKDT